MRQRKFTIWKIGIGIIIIGILSVLVFIIWTLGSTVHAYPMVEGQTQPGTVAIQVTPTEDATVTTLNKEKLAQEVQQLREQNEPNLLEWLRTNATILLVLGGGIFGLLRYLAERRDSQKRLLEDRQSERDKRDDERFQSAVTGLGNDNEGARIAAVIALRTFLKPGYEEFYIQIFDLVVANLRNFQTSSPLEAPILPSSSLQQALTVVFKEAFPLARKQFEGSPQAIREMQVRHPYEKVKGIPYLNARGIQLDNAYMRHADLKKIWMGQALLRNIDLKGATLSKADLYKAHLIKVKLTGVDLSDANLTKIDLFDTWFGKATLKEATLAGAKLQRVYFPKANLESVDLQKATLNIVDFTEANLERANLRQAKLTGTNLEKAKSLKDTDLRGVEGLTKEQLVACQTAGAIIDEDPTTNFSLPAITPSPPPQNNDTLTSSIFSAPKSALSLDTDEASTVSSKPDSDYS